MSLRLLENLEVLSGIRPWPCVARIAPQRLVLPDTQNLQAPHSGVYKGIT